MKKLFMLAAIFIATLTITATTVVKDVGNVNAAQTEFCLPGITGNIAVNFFAETQTNASPSFTGTLILPAKDGTAFSLLNTGLNITGRNFVISKTSKSSVQAANGTSQIDQRRKVATNTKGIQSALQEVQAQAWTTAQNQETPTAVTQSDASSTFTMTEGAKTQAWTTTTTMQDANYNLVSRLETHQTSPVSDSTFAALNTTDIMV
jgi:hypothetical protein